MDKKKPGDHWHLFIDNEAIARATGLSRIVHHPQKRGVVIPADQPWETAGVAPDHIFRNEEGLFVAFYIAMWWDCDKGQHIANEGFRRDRANHMFTGNAYATSADGIHWHKPVLGRAEGPSGIDMQRHYPFPSPDEYGKSNNLGVPFTVVADLGRYGNVDDPTKRYVLRIHEPASSADDIASAHGSAARNYFAPGIPDFLGDPDWREKLVAVDGTLDPRRHELHFWDALHEEWVAMSQGAIGHWLPSRDIARFASGDLRSWTSDTVLYPDPEDSHEPDRYDEPMALVPFCAEGVVFGLLSWFHSDRTHPDGGPVLEPSPDHPNRWPWCRKGTNEMRITISRDGGKSWDRTSSREAWIPHGTEEDSFDRLVIGPRPPIRVADEDWFYMDVVDGDHLIVRNDAQQSAYYEDRLAKHQIALYVQKHNRYVSLRAGNQTEVLITRPILVTGEKLQINVDASRGGVRVGVGLAEPVMTFGGTTPSDAPHLLAITAPNHGNHLKHPSALRNLLPGFDFSDCEPVRANGIEQTVSFGITDFAGLIGQKVNLLFEMQNADLYGFRFCSDQ